MQEYEAIMRQGGATALREAERFFMRADRVHEALRAITLRLDALNIPYAVAGGMALVAHGYDRTTVDVDVLLTPEGWQHALSQLEGLGYVAPFAGSRNLRDTATGVRIEFLLTGQYPGDGKPKPVAFPDPAAVAVEKDGIRYVSLPALIELKLASGLSAPHRLKDLADVQELIKTLRLPESLENQLNAYVQPKYRELWQAVQDSPERE